MVWWSYAFVAALFWGAQYVIAEMILKRNSFVSSFTYTNLINSLLTVGLMACLCPRNEWRNVLGSWQDLWLIGLYFLFGLGAGFFNALAISQKNATLVSLLEISYPIFVVLFTALLLRKTHLTSFGLVGMSMIFCGYLIVVLNRSE